MPQRAFNNYIEELDVQWTPYDNLIRYLILSGYLYDKVGTILHLILGLPGVPLEHFDRLNEDALDFRDNFEKWNKTFHKHYKMFFHRDLRNLLIVTISAGEPEEKIAYFIRSKSPMEITEEELRDVIELFWNIRNVKPKDLAIFLEFLSVSDPFLEGVVRRALAKYDLESLYIELNIIPTDDVDAPKIAKAILKKSYYSFMKSRSSLDAQRFSEIMSQAFAILSQAESDDDDIKKIFENIPTVGHKAPKVIVNENIGEAKVDKEEETEKLVPRDPEKVLESLPRPSTGSSYDIRVGNTRDELDDEDIDDLFPNFDPWE